MKVIGDWVLGAIVTLAVFVLLAGPAGMAPEVAMPLSGAAGLLASLRPGTPEAIRARAEYRRRRR